MGLKEQLTAQFKREYETADLQKIPEAEMLRMLKEAAKGYCLQGSQWNAEGNAGRAEIFYQRALQIYVLLLKMEEKEDYAAAAGECCEDLADLCMQQGNLHGADYYYVMVCAYGNRKNNRQESNGNKD